MKQAVSKLINKSINQCFAEIYVATNERACRCLDVRHASLDWPQLLFFTLVSLTVLPYKI